MGGSNFLDDDGAYQVVRAIVLKETTMGDGRMVICHRKRR